MFTRARFPLISLLAIGLSSSAVAQAEPTAAEMTALTSKFQLERAQAVQAKYPPDTLSRADELFKRGQAALRDEKYAAAARYIHDARWQLPYLPTGLPEHVVRVFGESRLRHSDRINGLAYNPEGTLLASCSRDGTVKVWDLGNGREATTYRGHMEQSDDPTKGTTNKMGVTSVAFHPQEKIIASAAGNQVHVWNPETGKLIKVLLNLGKTEKPIKTIAFRPDGRFLAVGADDGILRVVEFATGRISYTSPSRNARIESLAYSPNGKMIVVGDNNSQLAVYALDQQNPVVMSVQGLDLGEVRAVAFTNDSGAVLACGQDPVVRLFAGPKPDGTSAGNTATRLRGFAGHDGAVSVLGVVPNGSLLITGGKDCTVRVWDMSTGKQIRIFQGHQKRELGYGVTALAVRGDGRQVASGSDDGAMRLWDLNAIDEHRALTEATDSLWTVAYSPDGQRLATAGSDRSIRVYNTETFKVETVLSAGAKSPITSLAFFPDSNRLAAAGGDRQVDVWDIAKSKRIKELAGHESAILAVAVADNGHWIVSGSADRTVRAFTLESDKPLWTWAGRSAVCAVAIQKGSRVVAVGSADGTLVTLDTSGATPREVTTVPAHVSGIACLAFSPNGERLASVGGDGALRIWTASENGNLLPLTKFEGQLKAPVGGTSSPLTGVAFAPDNRYVATVGADSIVRIWDLEAKGESRGFRGHTDWATAVAFSPDGRFVASVGVEKDRILRIFELTHLETSPSGGHKLQVNAVAVSPDGKFVATAATDQTIKTWNIQTGKEVATLLENNDTPYALTFLGNDALVMGGSLPANVSGRLHFWTLNPGRLNKMVVTGEAYTVVSNTDGSKIGVWAARPAVGTDLKNHRYELYDAKGNLLTSASLNDAGAETQAVTFSTDLDWAVAGDDKGNVAIFELTKQKRLGDDWPLFVGAFTDLGITPDKKLVIAADNRGQVKVAAIENRSVLTSFNPHQAGVRALVVSPTGSTFVTLSKDREIKSWSLDPAKLNKPAATRTWNLPVGVNGAAYTPDGKRIVTANQDGTAYLLELP
jgi:WD40 repeat protein